MEQQEDKVISKVSPGEDFMVPFWVEGLKYQLEVDRDGTVRFGLCWGSTHKGTTYDKYDLFPEVPKYGDVDLARDAMKIFRQVAKLLEQYIHENRPHALTFKASTSRKARIYGWMTRRLLRRISGYDMCEYPIGTIVIFKRACLSVQRHTEGSAIRRGSCQEEGDMGYKKNMRNPIKRKILEANERNARERTVTMQTLINEGKVGEFDHLEERTDEFWREHQKELEKRNKQQ